MPQARINGITLEYEVSGPDNGIPVVLVMGFGTQMTSWPSAFHETLVEQGMRVLRFDNRDVGLSQKFDGILPDMRSVAAAMAQGQRPDVPYTLEDMADDVVALLDERGITSAHVAGASMGGMIAQLVAIRHPARARSLISMMSTTSDPSLPRSDPRAQEALMSRPAATDRDTVVAHLMKNRAILGSPGFPEDEAGPRALAAFNYDRSFYPEGTLRQWAAIMATPPRTAQLRRLNCRALVLHGEDDILIRPEAGHHTAASIPGAELRMVPGWGHNMPAPAVPVLAGHMVDFIRRVEADRTDAFATPVTPGCCGRQ